MDVEQECSHITVSELVKAFVALELEMTNDLPAEYRRLQKQNEVCIELTARGAWTEAGPQIDAEVARLRELMVAQGSTH